jgi:hypothetical protein
MTKILLLFLCSITVFSAKVKEENDADIVIAGGSLSALAAAITAANLTRSNPGLKQKIILLEPTDWPGGQLTASNVPPDFGPANNFPANLPMDFVNLLLAVAGPTW